MTRTTPFTLVHKMWATWGQRVDLGVEMLWIACECDVDGNPIAAGLPAAGVVHKIPTACGFPLCTREIAKGAYVRFASFACVRHTVQVPSLRGSTRASGLCGRPREREAGMQKGLPPGR